MSSAWGYNAADYYATAVWEPQRSWQFEMIIKGLDSKSLFPSSDKEVLEKSAGISANSVLSNVQSEQLSSIIKLSVVDVNFPRVHFNTTSLRKKNNQQSNLATGYELGNLEISFRDDCHQDIARTLYSWMQAVIDPESGKHGFPSYYKKDACLAMFSPDGNEVRFWVAHGMFPYEYSQDRFSHESNSSINLIHMSFMVDMIHPASVTEIEKSGFLLSMFI